MGPIADDEIPPIKEAINRLILILANSFPINT